MSLENWLAFLAFWGVTIYIQSKWDIPAVSTILSELGDLLTQKCGLSLEEWLIHQWSYTTHYSSQCVHCTWFSPVRLSQEQLRNPDPQHPSTQALQALRTSLRAAASKSVCHPQVGRGRGRHVGARPCEWENRRFENGDVMQDGATQWCECWFINHDIPPMNTSSLYLP